MMYSFSRTDKETSDRITERKGDDENHSCPLFVDVLVTVLMFVEVVQCPHRPTCYMCK